MERVSQHKESMTTMELGNGQLRKLFEAAFQTIGNRRRPPEIDVEFHPFVSLNNYIRVRNAKVYVKLSDILQDAPRSVHRALAHILVAKLFGKKPHKKFEAVYRSYTSDPSILQTIERVQSQRGRKRIIGPRGRARDLEKAFHRLNKMYFNGELEMPRLTWSERRTRRMLGHMDRTHNTLVISRTLDDLRIPKYFFEYILYHEMLHLKHAPRRVRKRYYYHTPEFRREERQFKDFNRAQEWLEKWGSRR